MDTTSVRLLQRFSSSLLSAEYPSAADTPPDLRAFWRKVGLSFNVLKELEENAKSALTGRDISYISRKKGKAVSEIRGLDSLPFDSMGIVVPTTEVEVRDVYVGVLSQLRNILEVRSFAAGGPCAELTPPQYYLLILRKPLVSKVFESSYIKANTNASSVVGSDQFWSSAFPMIQPIMAALYFDDVEGFGQWSILLSTQAQKYLRDVKCTNGAMFQIVMKKIK